MELQPLDFFNALGITLKEKFIDPIATPLGQLNQLWSENNQTPFDWGNKVEFIQFHLVKGDVKEYSLVSDTPLAKLPGDIHIVVLPYYDYSKEDFLNPLRFDCKSENGMSFLLN